jgi:hypothetical protein
MAFDHLRADCERCAALCCVGLAFARSSDFAIDKPAGQPCPNLRPDHRCGVHDRLRHAGFAGCAAFDCLGAGQRVTTRFDGRRDDEVLAAFHVVRGLHELLWLLTEAVELAEPGPVRDDLEGALLAIDLLANGDLTRIDVGSVRAGVNPLLVVVSQRARTDPAGPDHRGADLIGADLRSADLRGASFRGARLIGADLRSADLRRADFTGADLRGADLRGADLTDALFLQGSQLASARGDATTVLSPSRPRPAHW